jgi:hypothetical protein
MAITPAILTGSLATIDSHTIYKRTWYSKIKVQCAALGFALMSAVGMSILNPTNNIKTKMEALSFVVSRSNDLCGWNTND